MKAYIHACRTISRLNSFENGILDASEQADLGEVIHPDYKEIIPAQLIRRMTKIIRMGVGAALKVKEDYLLQGIVVGIGLGCLENTEKFLEQFVARKEGILSPTSFIQSTHNTVAGQIGIILQDNCYNSTYTQRGQSFENALIDAVLLSEETGGNVLLGGLDELIPLITELGSELDIDLSNLGEGASFFLVNQAVKNALAKIVACKTLSCPVSDLNDEIRLFLQAENLPKPDLILCGDSFPNANSAGAPYEGVTWKDYSKLSGVYMTNSAFGLQLAAEKIQASADTNNVLIVNNFNDKDFGLTYLTKP